MPATSPAWLSVQAADLLRQTEDRLLEAITALGPEIHAAITSDADVTLNADAVARLKEAIADANDLTDQLVFLADHLPTADAQIRYEAVRDQAASELATGIDTPQRAALAARVLDLKHGWPALATALTASDAPDNWQETTLGELLAQFRGVDQRLVRGVTGDAGLNPDQTFADCPHPSRKHLAAALRSYASRAPS